MTTIELVQPKFHPDLSPKARKELFVDLRQRYKAALAEIDAGEFFKADRWVDIEYARGYVTYASDDGYGRHGSSSWLNRDRLHSFEAKVLKLEARLAEYKHHVDWLGGFLPEHLETWRIDEEVYDGLLTLIAESLGATRTEEKKLLGLTAGYAPALAIRPWNTLGATGESAWGTRYQFPHPALVERFKSILDLLHPVMEAQYRKGFDYGSDLLRRTAGGEQTVHQLEEQRRKNNSWERR